MTSQYSLNMIICIFDDKKSMFYNDDELSIISLCLAQKFSLGLSKSAIRIMNSNFEGIQIFKCIRQFFI